MSEILEHFIATLPPREDQVNATTNETLPGYPDISMDSALLPEFLLDDLRCTDLDQIASRLWLMTEQRSSNISPLHRQKVKGREIIVTEEIKIHLVWFYNKVYIKPLPRYLLTQDFWHHDIFQSSKSTDSAGHMIMASALGLMRSYAHLIQYESDFRLARCDSLALIPESITWTQWRRLRSKLLTIRDADVSERYHFGEIRLTRLNFYCKLLLYKPFYYRTHRQYGEYFASFYPPLLFVFGIVSIMLGAMQLAATVEEYDAHWPGLISLYRISSACVMVFTSMLLVALVVVFLYKIVKEWVFALSCRYSRSGGYKTTRFRH